MCSVFNFVCLVVKKIIFYNLFPSNAFFYRNIYRLQYCFNNNNSRILKQLQQKRKIELHCVSISRYIILFCIVHCIVSRLIAKSSTTLYYLLHGTVLYDTHGSMNGAVQHTIVDDTVQYSAVCGHYHAT